MKALKLKVIDGFPAYDVLMVKPPVHGVAGCQDDKHCAGHGSGPFFCCRCGAEFLIKRTIYRVRYGHSDFERQPQRDFDTAEEAGEYLLRNALRAYNGASIEKVEVALL